MEIHSTKNLKIKRNISVPIYDIYRQVLVPIYPTYIYMLYIYLIHIFIVRCHVQKILTQITQPSHYIIYNIKVHETILLSHTTF